MRRVSAGMRLEPLLIALVVVSGCATRSTAPSFAQVPLAETATERYFETGDHFPVTIGLGPNPPVIIKVTVDNDGYIELPQIGKLRVIGMTESQFEEAAIAEYHRRGIVLHGMVHSGIVQ